jgi:hypothetical protein
VVCPSCNRGNAQILRITNLPSRTRET